MSCHLLTRFFLCFCFPYCFSKFFVSGIFSLLFIFLFFNVCFCLRMSGFHFNYINLGSLFEQNFKAGTKVRINITPIFFLHINAIELPWWHLSKQTLRLWYQFLSVVRMRSDRVQHAGLLPLANCRLKLLMIALETLRLVFIVGRTVPLSWVVHTEVTSDIKAHFFLQDIIYKE